MNPIFSVRKILTELVAKYPIVSLKGGTETEDMEEDELSFLKMASEGIVPVAVKIGGPEARTDMRICERIGIDGVSAPMIESEYALKNFVNSFRSVVSPQYFEKTKKSINLETITGYKNILDIFDAEEFESIHHVTAARSDLSASMNLKPDDKEVMRVAKNIVSFAKNKGKTTGVGGTITKYNFASIAEEIQPDFINSRHVMVETKRSLEFRESEVAEAMLLFEMELYDALSQLKPDKSYAYQKRIEINRERIGEKRLVYFIR